MRNIKLRYDPSLLMSWKTGRLHDEWFSNYKGLFDTDDLRLASTQHPRGYHFGEWFTAIHYHKKGYRVLQSKYANPRHTTKHAKALRLLDERQLAWLWNRGDRICLCTKGSISFLWKSNETATG
jgi:hypothetical protein